MALNLGKAVVDYLTAHPEEKFSASSSLIGRRASVSPGSARPSALTNVLRRRLDQLPSVATGMPRRRADS